MTFQSIFEGDFSRFTEETQLEYIVQLHSFVDKSNEAILSQLLQTNSIIPTLLSFFSNPDSGSIGDEAAYILAYISAGSSSQILVSHELISAITYLMESAKIERKREVVQILGNLSCDAEETRKMVRGFNGVRLLLRVITSFSGNEELVGSSCWAIANLIQDEDIPPEIADQVLSVLPFLVGGRALKKEEDMMECLRALSYITVPLNYDWSQILASKAITVMG